MNFSWALYKNTKLQRHYYVLTNMLFSHAMNKLNQKSNAKLFVCLVLFHLISLINAMIKATDLNVQIRIIVLEFLNDSLVCIIWTRCVILGCATNVFLLIDSQSAFRIEFVSFVFTLHQVLSTKLKKAVFIRWFKFYQINLQRFSHIISCCVLLVTIDPAESWRKLISKLFR